METPINFIILGITFIPVILILFAIFCLSYYSTKDPRLSENDKKTLNKKVKKQEFVLYIFNILLSICAIYIFHNYIKLFVLLPIFIIGFSIIFRAIKKIKISNILCAIIVVPAIIIIMIYTFYVSIDGFIFSHCNSNSYFDDDYYFNSKFIQYEGSNVTGSQVRALITQVVSSNSSEGNEDKQVMVGTGENDSSIVNGSTVNSESIKNSGRYKITCYYQNGIVYSVAVEGS